MKKKTMTAACMLAAVLFAKQASAQNQFPHASLYVHALYASALDKSSQHLYNNGFGGVAGVTYGKNNTYFVGSVGYTAFGSAFPPGDPENLNGDETYIPVKIGIRQHLPAILSFLFIQGDAGVGFISYKSVTANETKFAFDVGAGAQFGPFEAALVWDSFTEKSQKDPSGWSSWLTIQAGFTIGF